MQGILKRNGKIQKYDKDKIKEAVYLAALSTKSMDNSECVDLAILTMEKVNDILNENFFYNDGIPTVEEIQDIVEETLMRLEFTKVAKNYILYRNKHSKLRDTEKLFQDIMPIIDDYLDMSNWRVKENSNMGFSYQGLNNHISSEVLKRYWLQELYSDDICELHDEGHLHIHDLSSLTVYCCGWDLRDLVMTGFGGVSNKVESKPPKHFRTALGQIVNFFYTLQGEAAGAQAFSNFDTYLAPFIRYDSLNYTDVKQALQEFLFNMNVPTRVGFQAPFTNITMDLNPSPTIIDEPVIIGGKPMDETYGDFQTEMNMINEAFAEVMLEGDAKGRVFSFPIPTYNITKDFDWDNPIYNKIWEMTAKYGIPYFSNFVNSDMNPEDARSMCCRLRLDNRELKKRGGGLFGANPMTGSIGVVTLNMPRIGLLAENKEDLLERVFYLMDKAKESLELKRKVLEKLTNIGLYPYAKFYLRDIKKRHGVYWKNHFNTIGLNGMNECVLNFIGKDIASKEGIELAEEIMGAMRNKLVKYQKETDHMYNLEATPAEGTSYRLAKLDLDRYKNLTPYFANNERVYKENADPYYTNSSQLPVGYTDDIFEALELQDDIQVLYTGGTVFHGFIGESMPSIESTKKLVRKIAENFKLPYYTITPTFSICPIHGYLSGEHKFCPKCDVERGIK